MLRIAIALVAVGLSSFASSSRAQTCAPFIDVPAADPFCSNIQWMFNRGVTLGCTANQYCPANAVRRDQMAAFMFRLAHDVVFQDGGNAFGNPAVLGTTDNNALDLRVNNARVMRYEPNAVSPNEIGGSPVNNVTAGVRGATIGGGGVPVGNTDPDFELEAPNRVTDAYGTVGGGFGNQAGDDAGTGTDQAFATVAGGQDNTASRQWSTVAGGLTNIASGLWSAIAGGAGNNASSAFTTIAGGDDNTASSTHATVAGGGDNTARGGFATVAGGSTNTACGAFATVAGGSTNTASASRAAVSGGDHNLASSSYATVPGGFTNTASGVASFAAGNKANANDTGCFVWGDFTTTNQVSCDGPNKFVVRSLGGVFFFSSGDTDATYNGVHLAPGDTAWTVASDRRLKENMHNVDTADVLDKVLAMPISTWNLKSQNASIRHMGAMAQDFRAAFGLGETEFGINTIDADGVALAAIPGLNAKVDAQAREIEAMRASHAAEIAALRHALERVLARGR